MGDDVPSQVDRFFETTNEQYVEYPIRSNDEIDHYRLMWHGHENAQRGFTETADPTMDDLIGKEAPGCRDDGESIYYFNCSSGIQFAAVANLIYEAAVERGLGTTVPLD